MTSSSKFDLSEWSLIQKAPLLVFYDVAIADERVESSEVERLIRQFKDTKRYQSDLFTQAVASLMESPEQLEVLGTQVLHCSAEEIYDQIAVIQTLIDRKLEPDTAKAFKKALIMLGTDIAAATGDSSLPVSKVEWLEVSKIQQLLKI